MKQGAVMRRTAYLEAADRSQDLLTTKWILRSCGYVIKSTWHEESRLASGGPQSHWSWARLEELKVCDTLVLVRGQEKELPPELASFVGFAAARNLRVIWVGLPIDLLACFKTVQLFATLDEFRKELLRENDPPHTLSSDDVIAA
jgi:hypothetical protein